MSKIENWQVSHKDISEECGVSRRVVSAILTPSEGSKQIRFSDKTQSKVEKTAKELGYRPNRTVANFKKKRHGAYTLLMTTAHSLSQNGMQGFMDTAKKYNILLNIEVSNSSSEELPIALREDSCDGIIIMDTVHSKIVDEVLRLKIPVIQINNPNSVIPHTISFDDDDLMKQIANRFISAGKKRIAIINHDSSKYDIVKNQALIKHLTLQNLPEPIIIDAGKFWVQKEKKRDILYDIVKKTLTENSEIDAVFLSQSLTFSVAYDVIKSLNKKIPEDISIIGLFNSSGSDFCTPSLTVFDRPDYGAGEKSIEMMNDILNGNKVNNIKLKYNLLARESG